MRWGLAASVVMVAFVSTPAWADEPPVVVEPPLEPPLEELPAKPSPSPVKIEMPAPSNPPPSTEPPKPPTPPTPIATPTKIDRGSFVELGIGPTYLGVVRSSRTFSEIGAMFQVGARLPIRDHYGVGFRFAYALTGWDRMEAVARPGYKVGQWTTQAYKDTWEWVGEGEPSMRLPRGFVAFLGSIFLAFPYVVAGMFYLVSPLAASSYAEVDATFNWEPGDDPKYTPFVKAGVAFAAYVHPDTDQIFGGLGPHLSFGYRLDNITLGLAGTFLPNGLHGRERFDEHVMMGSFVVGLVH